MAFSSERQFEPKLNLARRARVIDDTESGSFKDLAGRPEIGMVRRIEQIAPKLDRFPFPRNEGADDRAIDRSHARGADVSDALVAEHVLSRLTECAGIEPAQQRSIFGGKVRIMQNVRPKRPGGV